LLGLPLGIALIRLTTRRWHNGITVYEHGFTLKHNRKTRTWRWTEIDQLDTRIIRSVFGGSEVNSRVNLSIDAQNHPPLKLKHRYEKMAELAQLIRSKTLPVLYQKTLPKLNLKDQIVFNNKIKLDKARLSYGEEQLDWNEIESVETLGGMLTFRAKNSKNNPVKIPLNHIKNLDLLLFIVHNPDLRENLAD